MIIEMEIKQIKIKIEWIEIKREKEFKKHYDNSLIK